MKKLFLLTTVLVLALTAAFGQDSKISDLSSASQPLNDVDLFVVVQSATTKKYTYDNLFEDIHLTDYSIQNAGLGSECLFLGHNVGTSYSSGNSNYAYGNACMGALNGANENNAFGSGSMTYLTSGDYNNAFGSGVMPNITTGSGNCGFGEGVMYDGTVTGDYNIGFGYLPLFSITSGSYNIGIGKEALYTATDNTGLVAIGHRSQYAAQTGAIGNTSIGDSSLYAITTGDYCTAIGGRALRYTTGSSNTGGGYQALRLNTSGASNVAFGGSALESNTTNSYSVGIGVQAGELADNSGCIYLGYQAGQNNATDNLLYIDNSNTASPLIGGDFDNNRVGIGMTIASIAHALDIAGDANCTGGWAIDGTDRIDGDGYFIPKSSTDAAAPNNSIYYSTDAGKLVYKDAGGTPRALY